MIKKPPNGDGKGCAQFMKFYKVVTSVFQIILILIIFCDYNPLSRLHWGKYKDIINKEIHDV
jgi:hypothetical protein